MVKPIVTRPGSNPSTIQIHSASSHGNAATASFIQKDWVVPPRPRPGRKPAGELPPSKRKAQNREAQRAFRERRAAKVGELEDQLRDVENERQREHEAIVRQVGQLGHDLEECRAQLEYWHRKYRELERSTIRSEKEKEERVGRNAKQVKRVATCVNPDLDSTPISSEQADIPWQDKSGSPLGQGQDHEGQDTNATCGRCEGSTQCPCIEEAFELVSAAEPSAGLAEPTKPEPQNQNRNRNIRSSNSKSETQSDGGTAFVIKEIDFTAAFASSTTSDAPVDSGQGTRVVEPCGFCSDGNICICAAITNDTDSKHKIEPQSQDLGLSGSEGTHKGEGDGLENTTTATKLVSTVSQYTPSSPHDRRVILSDSCNGDPGSCSQCQTNPTSTLFCKTLASAQSRRCASSSQSIPTGSTTQATPIDDDDVNSESEQAPRNSCHGPTVTCADAFTTLSRHAAFPRATNELGSWVSRLTAVPGTESAKAKGKTAFEIEAASIMSVLKFFDNRFNDQSE